MMKKKKGAVERKEQTERKRRTIGGA